MTEHDAERDAESDCCGLDIDPRIPRCFDEDMTRYQEPGDFPPLAVTSRGLLELLSDVGAVKPTVLELGSGSGGLSVALLERGAASADGIDLSPGSVEVARRRAAEADVADRATFTVGDGAQAELESHDWVVLDRVICCYPHVDRLLANAIGATRSRFVMAVPLSSGWRSWITRAIVSVENATNRLRGRPCPGYVHPIPMIEQRLADAGFRQLRSKRIDLWHAAVWERQPGR